MNKLEKEIQKLEYEFIDQVYSKIYSIIKDRVLFICPDFDIEEEKQRRFKRIIQEVRGEIHSFYFNDTSIRGLHLFSYKIVYPHFDLNNLSKAQIAQIVEVNDHSL